MASERQSFCSEGYSELGDRPFSDGPRDSRLPLSPGRGDCLGGVDQPDQLSIRGRQIASVELGGLPRLVALSRTIQLVLSAAAFSAAIGALLA